MTYFLKILNVFILATVKFFYTPIYAFLIGLNLFETILTTIAGGLAGFIIFYNFSYLIILTTRFLKPYAKKIIPVSLQTYYRNWKTKRAISKKNQKIFSRKNRFIVKTRNTYGMWGIVILTPIFLSIPIGAFLLRKYYSDNPSLFLLVAVTIIVEGIVLSLGTWLLPLDFLIN